ncbi:MAG: response regulator [Gammaproteobacteria bacterium]|nr:response regulator [Gammaproteobacteria bacterium]
MSHSDIKLEKILIVDDDKALCELLQRYLSDNGYTTQSANDGIEMFQLLEQSTPDIIILDLMLPGEDGLTLSKKIRRQSNTPIIILSARGDDVDRIVGLEVGADDYLSKPFNPRELLARIRSVLRRSNTEQNKPATDSEDIIFDDYRMLTQTRQLFLNEEEVLLTSGEFTLLEVFANNPNRVLNRDSLLQLLKGYEHHPYDRSIDVRITRLRRKIEADPTKPVFIRTVWGKGYLFTPNPEEH